MWATGLHARKIKIFKHERRAAKDRQWSKDSNLIGIVERDGKEWGPIAYRESEWNNDRDDHLKSKLVIKAFTPSDYWRGSIELQMGTTVMLSSVANEPTPAFIVNYDGSQYVTRIQKVPHKNFFSTRGEVWGFDLLLDDEVKTFEIDDNRFTLGTDFYVKDINNLLVARIDGKLWNVCGRYTIEIYDKDLAKDKRFYITLVLFTATIEFLDSIKEKIKLLVNNLQRGEKLVLESSEKELYFNPRRMTD